MASKRKSLGKSHKEALFQIWTRPLKDRRISNGTYQGLANRGLGHFFGKKFELNYGGQEQAKWIANERRASRSNPPRYTYTIKKVDGEYIVKFWKDGKWLGEGPTYYTTEKSDAEGTGRAEVERLNNGTATASNPPRGKMTLAAWSKKHGIKVGAHDLGAKLVPAEYGKNSHRDLYSLKDYNVSTVTAGTVWLTKKRGSKKNPGILSKIFGMFGAKKRKRKTAKRRRRTCKRTCRKVCRMTRRKRKSRRGRR